MSFGDSSTGRSGNRSEGDGDVFATDHGDYKICHCGYRLPRMTAWTPKNPGRRFWSCQRCSFYEFKDPKHPEWSRKVIVHLMETKHGIPRMETDPEEMNESRMLKEQLQRAIEKFETSSAKMESIQMGMYTALVLMFMMFMMMYQK